jgi:ABC-type Zn uptake system ZnuABC Zn-binding protein ZnuA
MNNVKSKIDKLQTCIEILEAITHFENMIKLKKESINGFSGTFPELRKKYLHNIQIYQKCMIRLIQRYKTILNQIQ